MTLIWQGVWESPSWSDECTTSFLFLFHTLLLFCHPIMTGFWAGFWCGLHAYYGWGSYDKIYHCGWAVGMGHIYGRLRCKDDIHRTTLTRLVWKSQKQQPKRVNGNYIALSREHSSFIRCILGNRFSITIHNLLLIYDVLTCSRADNNNETKLMRASFHAYKGKYDCEW